MGTSNAAVETARLPHAQHPLIPTLSTTCPALCRPGLPAETAHCSTPNIHSSPPCPLQLPPPPAGQSSLLASRLQSLRQQLRLLQQQIDACDEAVEESRARKRRRLERQAGGREEGRRGRGGGQGRGGSRQGSREGSAEPGEAGSSSMEVSGSSSGSESEGEDRGAATGDPTAAGSPFPSSQEVRQQLGPLLQRKQQLKKEAAAAAAALQASSAAVAARRKELRAAVVAQVSWLDWRGGFRFGTVGQGCACSTGAGSVWLAFLVCMSHHIFPTLCRARWWPQRCQVPAGSCFSSCLGRAAPLAGPTAAARRHCWALMPSLWTKPPRCDRCRWHAAAGAGMCRCYAAAGAGMCRCHAAAVASMPHHCG